MRSLNHNNLMVSVIIPVYNVEKYLERCIRSVQNQSFSDIEILLIDDGSTDSSGLLCDQFAESDSRIQVIHKDNGGLSSARNRGIDEARGEYIIFLDSDDYWIGDFLAVSIKSMEDKSVMYDLIIGNAQKVSESTGERTFIGKHFDNREVDVNDSSKTLEYMLTLDPKFEWYVWKYLIKRSLLLDAHLFFIDGIMFEDVEFTPRVLLAAHKIMYVDHLFVNYTYQREKSLLNTKNEKRTLDKIFVCKKICDSVSNDQRISLVLRRKLLSNISTLFLSAYSDYVNSGNVLFRGDLQANMWLLAYNHSNYGRTVWACYRTIGFNSTLFIIKFVLKLIQKRNEQRSK